MEKAILGLIVLIALTGIVLTVVLLRMILTKDYSLLFGGIERREPEGNVSPSALSINNGSLDLAVAHFVKETVEWTSETERIKQEQELRELRMRRQ